MKIISSAAGKNKFITSKGNFHQLPAMKVFLMEKFADHLPDDINFTLGYLEEKQSKKRWLHVCRRKEVREKVKLEFLGNDIQNSKTTQLRRRRYNR